MTQKKAVQGEKRNIKDLSHTENSKKADVNPILQEISTLIWKQKYSDQIFKNENPKIYYFQEACSRIKNRNRVKGKGEGKGRICKE